MTIQARQRGKAARAKLDSRLSRKKSQRGLDESMRARTRIIFESADVDDNGTLDAKEIARVLTDHDVPVSESYVQGVLDVYDTDGSGTLDLEEFTKLFKTVSKRSEQQREKQNFLMLPVPQPPTNGPPTTARASWRRGATKAKGAAAVDLQLRHQQSARHLERYLQESQEDGGANEHPFGVSTGAEADVRPPENAVAAQRPA